LQLQNKTKAIRTWVTKEVAHYDQQTGKFAEGLTFADLNAAIDLVAAVFRRYALLIQAVDVLPVPITQPWAGVFRVPWLPDNSAVRDVQQATDKRERERLAGQ
jgi:hypothetical protein